MSDNQKEAIQLLENSIDLINRDGVERLIVIVKTKIGVSIGWIAMDTYNFGGMMMEAGQQLAARVEKDLSLNVESPSEAEDESGEVTT